jgi:hypothetical protein
VAVSERVVVDKVPALQALDLELQCFGELLRERSLIGIEKQIGLLGKLIFLERIVTEFGNQAFDAWVGPLGDLRPLTLWNHGSEKPVHVQGVIVEASQVNVCRDRSGRYDSEKMFSSRLHEWQFAEGFEVVVLRCVEPAILRRTLFGFHNLTIMRVTSQTHLSLDVSEETASTVPNITFSAAGWLTQYA